MRWPPHAIGTFLLQLALSLVTRPADRLPDFGGPWVVGQEFARLASEFGGVSQKYLVLTDARVAHRLSLEGCQIERLKAR